MMRAADLMDTKQLPASREPERLLSPLVYVRGEKEEEGRLN